MSNTSSLGSCRQGRWHERRGNRYERAHSMLTSAHNSLTRAWTLGQSARPRHQSTGECGVIPRLPQDWNTSPGTPPAPSRCQHRRRNRGLMLRRLELGVQAAMLNAPDRTTARRSDLPMPVGDPARPHRAQSGRPACGETGSYVEPWNSWTLTILSLPNPLPDLSTATSR